MDIKEIINKRYAMPDASLHKLQQCLTDNITQMIPPVALK